jgi:hypothetical protein
VTFPASLVGDLVEARFGRAQPPVGLIPRDAVQPGSQLVGVLRGAAILCRDNEGLPQDRASRPARISPSSICDRNADLPERAELVHQIISNS